MRSPAGTAGHQDELLSLSRCLTINRPHQHSIIEGCFRLPSIGWAAFYVLSWCCVESASAQAPSAAWGNLATPTTTHERLAIETSALSDDDARVIGGARRVRIITIGVEVDKAKAEAFLAERSVGSPHRLVSPQTNQTVRTPVSPSENRVTSLEGISVSATPCVRVDTGQPPALAEADPAIHRVVGDSLDRYGTLESGSEAQCCRPPFNSMVYWVSPK